MEFIQIEVATRDTVGTSNSRRLRRDGQIPAVLYGMKRPNMQLSIPATELGRFLRTGSHLVELRLGEETRPAILREVQHDPVTDSILHVDFHRVDHALEVEDHVHVAFKGRARGETEGGVFQVLKETIHVRGRPKHLPESFLLEIGHLAVGDGLRVSELDVPAGVTVLEDEDAVIAQCALPKRVASSTADEDAEGEEIAEGEAAPAEAGEAGATETTE